MPMRFLKAAQRAAKKTRTAAKGAKAGMKVNRVARNAGNAATRRVSGSSTPRRTPTPPRRTTPVAPSRSNSYSPPRSSTGRVNSNSWGGGSSSGSRGGGGGGGLPGGAVATVPEPPKPPSIEEWLAGDTTWMSQQDALTKALADYETEMERNKSQYQTEFDTNVSNLGTSREAALGDLENDYAGRGLLNSGLYANSTSELMSDYDARQAALESGRSNFLADLLSQFGNFQSEQDLSRTSARQDAINRRAAQYGL